MTELDRLLVEALREERVNLPDRADLHLVKQAVITRARRRHTLLAAAGAAVVAVLAIGLATFAPSLLSDVGEGRPAAGPLSGKCAGPPPFEPTRLPGNISATPTGRTDPAARLIAEYSSPDGTRGLQVFEGRALAKRDLEVTVVLEHGATFGRTVGLGAEGWALDFSYKGCSYSVFGPNLPKGRLLRAGQEMRPLD